MSDIVIIINAKNAKIEKACQIIIWDFFYLLYVYIVYTYLHVIVEAITCMMYLDYTTFA
jgi:hypothetical protein